MYCKHCGKEVNDNAVVCIHCGCSLQEKNILNNNGITESGSKTTLGLLLAFFLGLLGLIIGVCLYPSGSYERETFMQGWKKGFAISIIIGVILGGVLYGCSIAMLV